MTTKKTKKAVNNNLGVTTLILGIVSVLVNATSMMYVNFSVLALGFLTFYLGNIIGLITVIVGLFSYNPGYKDKMINLGIALGVLSFFSIPFFVFTLISILFHGPLVSPSFGMINLNNILPF